MKRSKKLSVLGIFLIAAAIFSFLVFYLLVMISNQGYKYIDPDTLELVQTEPIPEGSPVVIIETSMGEIRAVLYPEYAPQTVAAFTALAEQTNYDASYLFDIKNGIYFAGGSTDTIGTPIQENRIPQELHQNLWPFRGALCAMNTAKDTSFFKRLFKTEAYYTDSRFLILDTIPDFQDEAFITQFQEASGNEALANAFLSLGGVPNFSQQITVFGQTYAGFSVIDQICAAELQSETASGYTPPKEEMQILSVRLSSYSQEDEALNELS